MLGRFLLAFALALPLLTGCGGEDKGAPKSGGGNANNPLVEMKTSMGAVRIELFEDKAPITVKNFLGYVDEKHYDGLIFHRVIPNFMIQGGGFKPGMEEVMAGPPIKNESKNDLANERGTLAMARTNNPHSATNQFFINVKYNDSLDRAGSPNGWGYAVFGKVVSGMDVVDKIQRVRTANRGGHEAVPVEDVVIESIRRVEK